MIALVKDTGYGGSALVHRSIHSVEDQMRNLLIEPVRRVEHVQGHSQPFEQSLWSLAQFLSAGGEFCIQLAQERMGRGQAS